MSAPSIGDILKGIINRPGSSATDGNGQSEQGPSSPGNSEGGSGGNFNSFQWLLAWTVLIVVLVFLARTRIGYLLIYYALALSVVFLLVTQYKWFANVLAPFSSLRPGVVTDQTANFGPTVGAVGAVPGAAAAQQQLQGA